ncbi:hypothetical protein WA026_004938 [Henosepilachna vigintioctopunctata]|uniref:protein-tyrosine-phosphatase n=1 Tax=Henosepilachna vigintioctopunctata TaxID=420089 RepID=A0AAW1UMI0_9CUCU
MDKKSSCQLESDKMVEILKNQLYFAVIRGLSGKKIKSTADALYFSIDDEFQYQNYYFDFGPYNISYVYKYCTKLNKYLHYSQGQKRVVHCTSTNAEKKVNAAFLIGCYCIIYLKIHPSDVTKLLMKAGPYKSFMDASQIPCPYTIKLEFCFNAIAKARAFNFFNFDDFDVTEYDMYEKLQFGDMNWLVPRKFLAFIGPNSSEFLNGHPPDYYIKYFLKNDIKTVIRLNSRMYDAAIFNNAGINHFDLIYPDGSTPSKDILMKFLQIAETAPAAIAVHCKAGLGRTGSLIGAYIIKHYKMTAKEAIAWMRICRPGSVIGQQQIWLEKLQLWLWKSGSHYRSKNYGDGDKIPRHKYGVYSKMWPVERAKILREVRRKYTAQYSVSDPEQISQSNRKLSATFARTKQPYHRFKLRNIKEAGCFDDIAAVFSNVYGLASPKPSHPNYTIPNKTSGDPKYSTVYPRTTHAYRAAEEMSSDPITSSNRNVDSAVNESQGDSIFIDEKDLSNRSEPIKVHSRINYTYKIDTDTDTSDYVHSYMEERAMRRKGIPSRGAVVLTQGDRLLTRKLYKSGRRMRTGNVSNSYFILDERQSNQVYPMGKENCMDVNYIPPHHS